MMYKCVYLQYLVTNLDTDTGKIQKEKKRKTEKQITATRLLAQYIILSPERRRSGPNDDCATAT